MFIKYLEEYSSKNERKVKEVEKIAQFDGNIKYKIHLIKKRAKI
jgi:hypothetical protein